MIQWTRYETFVFILLSTYPVILYQVFELKWLNLPWLPIALVGTAVAFVIGFQNNAAYGRIWEARKIWGGIVNASRSWTIMVNDFISDEHAVNPVTDSELHDIRRNLIMRHIAWLTALRHSLRQPKPWEHFLKHKSNRDWSDRMNVREHKYDLQEEMKDYLSASELKYVLEKSNKSTHCISLQSKQLTSIKRAGYIEDFRHMEMEKLLVDLYGYQGKSERIKNFPYPRQFATLNVYFVWIFVILLPFGIMNEFDKIGTQLVPDFPIIGHLFVWFSIPFSVVVSWVFHTMERIGRVGENPFEGTANDVPITTMSRAIEIDIREMLDEDKASIPKPIEEFYNIQM